MGVRGEGCHRVHDRAEQLPVPGQPGRLGPEWGLRHHGRHEGLHEEQGRGGLRGEY